MGPRTRLACSISWKLKSPRIVLSSVKMASANEEKSLTCQQRVGALNCLIIILPIAFETKDSAFAHRRIELYHNLPRLGVAMHGSRTSITLQNSKKIFRDLGRFSIFLLSKSC